MISNSNIVSNACNNPVDPMHPVVGADIQLLSCDAAHSRTRLALFVGVSIQTGSPSCTYVFPAHNVQALGTGDVSNDMHPCCHEAFFFGPRDNIHAGLEQPGWAVFAVELLHHIQTDKPEGFAQKGTEAEWLQQQLLLQSSREDGEMVLVPQLMVWCDVHRLWQITRDREVHGEAGREAADCAPYNEDVVIDDIQWSL